MVLSFSTPRQTVLESDQFATVCVSKSNPSMLIVSASIKGVRGTADSSIGKEDGSGEEEEEEGGRGIRSGILNHVEEGRGKCGVGWWMISLNI